MNRDWNYQRIIDFQLKYHYALKTIGLLIFTFSILDLLEITIIFNIFYSFY